AGERMQEGSSCSARQRRNPLVQTTNAAAQLRTAFVRWSARNLPRLSLRDQPIGEAAALLHLPLSHHP
ncbi:MAG: hypothetical protein J2P37_25930, partial [Ktedonobacteraceae bacterium]|nr:hypothetical protein [Ktedonobacteraceae bacterium]